jgi:hypothetical protein
MTSSRAVTVSLVEPAIPLAAPASARPHLDADSREGLRRLRGDETARDDAVARLHALLLRAARFEVARRRRGLPHLRGEELGPRWAATPASTSSTDTSSSNWPTRTPTPKFRGLRAHLDGCPACREEYESLHALAGGDLT